MDKYMQHQVELNKQASMPVIADLAQKGINVEWISDLYTKKLKYRNAIPILIKWLPLIDNLDVKESIVRALSIPWAKPMAAGPLIREFEKADLESIDFKWAIANSLSVVADDSVFSEIVNLVQDKKNGKAREMLALSLDNMKTPQALDVLIALLKDDVVVGHAVMALGKLKARKAYPAIKQLLNHPKPWVRKEAVKALSKIDKANT